MKQRTHKGRADLKSVSDAAHAALRVSPEFEERCVNAALVAFSIAKMRDERDKLRKQAQDTGNSSFIGIPVEKYVQGLGHFARVHTDSVLESVGIARSGPIELANAARWAKLVQHLRMTLSEVKTLVRIGFANRLGYPIEMAAARRSNALREAQPDEDAMENYQRAADEIESDYPPELRQELAGILNVIEVAYRDFRA
jgi:hypothetical protein